MIDIDTDAATVIAAQAKPGVTQHVIRRIRESFGSDSYVGMRASAALGKGSRSIFQDAHAAHKRAWGQWTIFDHCLPFGVTRALDATRRPSPGLGQGLGQGQGV